MSKFGPRKSGQNTKDTFLNWFLALPWKVYVTATVGSSWRQTDLTWDIDPNYYPDGLAVEDVDRDIAAAFQVWADHSRLTFTRTSVNPVIRVFFYPRVHGDGIAFDGPSGVLAHTYFPQAGGDGHFDAEESWTVNSNSGKKDHGRHQEIFQGGA